MKIMKEKEPAKPIPVKDLLFKKFKEGIGIKVFILKYNNEGNSNNEKIIYNKVLSVLKEKNYLDYSISKSNIQIFLTDTGRRIVDKRDQWEDE